MPRPSGRMDLISSRTAFRMENPETGSVDELYVIEGVESAVLVSYNGDYIS